MRRIWVELCTFLHIFVGWTYSIGKFLHDRIKMIDGRRLTFAIFSIFSLFKLHLRHFLSQFRYFPLNFSKFYIISTWNVIISYDCLRKKGAKGMNLDIQSQQQSDSCQNNFSSEILNRLETFFLHSDEHIGSFMTHARIAIWSNLMKFHSFRKLCLSLPNGKALKIRWKLNFSSPMFIFDSINHLPYFDGLKKHFPSFGSLTYSDGLV